MADSAVAEEIRKRRAAAALNGQDDDSEQEDAGTVEDTAALAEEESTDQGATDQGEVLAAPAEKVPSLGYRFVPVALPNVSRGTFRGMGEEGLDVPPLLTAAAQPDISPQATSKIYTGPAEEGGQRYVIDQDTGQKVPYAEPATAEDKAAQPPSGVQFQKEIVTGQAPVEPAPDKLTQVERAELVKPPPEAPSTLPQVERGELVSVPPGTAPRATAIPTAAQVQPAVPVTPFMGEEGLDVTPTPPKVQRALGYKFVPVAPAVKPAEPVTQATQVPKDFGEDIRPSSVEGLSRAVTATFTNPNGSDLPVRVQAVGDKDPAAFIVHHTSGRGTVDGVVSTLKERGLGVQYVMDREGNIFATGGPGAQNIRAGWGSKGAGLSNQNVVGMEIIAKDDHDVTPAQAQSFARFIAARYPSTVLFGHGEVNPGHKEADEGLSAKAAALAYREAGATPQVPGAAPQAQPVTKQVNGLYQNEKPQDFLTGKATTFATPEDLASGQDNGVGAPRLGKLDTTQAAGVAIPEEALRAKYGNNYAAWRTARVDVIDQETGKRLRLPIVDLGPRGDLNAIVDMTPSISSYFGGDKNLSVKLVDKAGPDVTKNPQLFADEQAAIKQGFDSSTLQPGVQKIVPKLGYKFQPQSPEGAAQARETLATAIQQQRVVISKLPEAGSGNVIGLYKRLDQPVEGTTSQSRQAAQANLKPQIIALMREKFPELKTDDEAWAKAQSDVGALDVGREAWSKMIGGFQEYTNVLQKGVAGTDQLHVNQFIDSAMPGASDADKHAYLTHLYSLPVDQRIAEIQSKLPQPQAGMPSTDPQQIVSALDRLSDPNFQKRQAAELGQAQTEMRRNLTTDPRLVGTGVGKIVDSVAQMPSFLAAYSNPVMLPLALAQTSDMAREAVRQAHPEWDEKTVNDSAALASAVMFFGQEAGAKLMSSGGGALLNALEGKGKRAIAQALAGSGGAAAIGAATQAGINVATGQPVGQGVGGAALTGGIQGLVTGAAHGAGELMRPGGEPVRERTEQPPPVTEPPVRPAGEPVRPIEPASRGEEGIVPPAKPPAVPVTQEDVARRAYELYDERTKNGQPGTAYDDWAKAQQELSQGVAPAPVTQGEAEPWVSAIANRFTAERAARGEVGDVIPGEGYSKEELLAQGLQMGPEQIAQHVSDLMNNVGGDPRAQAGAVRAEEARLSQRSNAASRASEAAPGNQQLHIDMTTAFQDLTDFHNGPVAKLKNNWHAQGMTLQGEIPIDLSTFNGMREKFLRDVGKPPEPKMEPVLRKTAQRVRDSVLNDDQAMRNLGAEIEKQTARRKLPTADEVRARIMERMKVDPCPS